MTSRKPVIVIFDVGKTNKKLLLFDEDYAVVHEESRVFDEVPDNDGFPSEDIIALTNWIRESFARVNNDPSFEVRAVNFSAYGASFALLDRKLNVIPPLSNYLKPFPDALKEKFYGDHGGEANFSRVTASPVLGNLNSGMQLYRLKHTDPARFGEVRHALHLPQYLSFVLSGSLRSDITSVGCHTNLWDFTRNRYHEWVTEEGIDPILAPLAPCKSVTAYIDGRIPAGIGLHDSSSALIPYLVSFNEPFLLLSTGTWCISLNPFNPAPLTDEELKQDCLCYLSYEGQPVKASRLFAGHEHERQVKKLATHFGKPEDHYTTVKLEKRLLDKAGFKNAITEHDNYEAAYHQFMSMLVDQQVNRTNLVLNRDMVRNIYVDGGFSHNPVYMYLIRQAYKDLRVFAASVAQASALGAALVMHDHWNGKPLPATLIELRDDQ